jgi:acetolactate synthase I/II/III large subunit
MTIKNERRGADRLAEAIHKSGVNVIFSLSGNQIMPLYDAIFEFPIRLIHTRHEAAAVFMAEAYAQVSGQIGVALVTAAPGFANALGALYSAAMSESPVIFLSGDSPCKLDGQGAFQEFDQFSAAKAFVKHSFRLTLEDDPAEIFAQAKALALNGTPGPVHIALPADLLEAVNDHWENDTSYSNQKVVSDPISRQDLTLLLNKIYSANKPLILAGPHVFRAQTRCQLTELASLACVPIIDLDSPRGLRDPAKGAIKSVLAESDLVIYLGKRIDFMSGFASTEIMPNSKLVLICDDMQYTEHAQRQFAERLSLTINSDAQSVVKTLMSTDEERFTQTSMMESRKTWMGKVQDAISYRQLAVYDEGEKASHLAAIAIGNAVAKTPDTVLICDGGEFGQWAQGYVTANTRITNGPSGAIGAGLPYAIGAKVANPDTPVVAIMGDGTAGFHFAEFETAAREGLDLTIIIGNDSKWNAEHVIQQRDYGHDRAFGCSLQENTRYDIAATGLGCKGENITDLTLVEKMIEKSMSGTGTTCINISLPGAPAPQYSNPRSGQIND